tara:strand:+ start:408 stop:1004 length:597 start_codon:yes stop_codon:yes gene_type:complete
MADTVEKNSGPDLDLSETPARVPAVADAVATPPNLDPSNPTITLKVAVAEPGPPNSTADIPAAPDPAPADPSADDLAAQLSELRDLLRTEQKARVEAESARETESTKRREQAEAARKEWLESQGFIRWDYQTLAPTVDQADPFSEEGKRLLARFRTDNPELFKGAPGPPSAKPGVSDGMGRKRWRDVMGDGIIRGLNE